MPTRTVTIPTAIIVMAVLYSLLAGCATPRMVDELKAQVAEVEAQNKQTQAMVARIDSVLAEEIEASKRLRHDLSVTISDLQRQVATLLENNNDLMQRFEQLVQDLAGRGVLRPSPGAQPDTADRFPPPGIDCEETYDNAFILVRRGEYEQAIAGFQSFLSQCGSHQLVENAYYWTGECFYSLEQYESAITQFEQLLSQFKNSPNASRAMYKLGRSQQELGKSKEAKEVFQRIVDEYPGTLEAEQAKERLIDLK